MCKISADQLWLSVWKNCHSSTFTLFELEELRNYIRVNENTIWAVRLANVIAICAQATHFIARVESAFIQAAVERPSTGRQMTTRELGCDNRSSRAQIFFFAALAQTNCLDKTCHLKRRFFLNVFLMLSLSANYLYLTYPTFPHSPYLLLRVSQPLHSSFVIVIFEQN